MDRMMPIDSSVNSDEDEDIISDTLLTSLTDAAISNLSQLAALQERCESQQQQQQQPQTFRHNVQRVSSSTSSAAAAAAVAAANAAANQSRQQQPQAHLLMTNTGSQSNRLITSALTSPDFFHNLQPTTTHRHAQNNIPSYQQPQQHRTLSSQHSHFPTSATSSIAPSPCSQITRRSTPTTSSLMSPIASPNYFRRQIMSDRLGTGVMSPSPTSGLSSSGISSGASSSLGHILHPHQHPHHQQRSASALAGPITPLSSTPLSACGSSSSSAAAMAAVNPLINSKNSSQARLNNMQIRHKFGYLGSGRAQFNSPHGFCLGVNQEIVVADTNNHRVCIFDKSGTYLTQFGSPGKEEGQLWNPRKVAILHRPTTSSSMSNVTTSVPLPPHLQRHHNNQSLMSASSSSSSAQQVGQFPGSSGSSSNNNNGNNIISNNNSVNKSSIFNGNEPLYVVCDRGAERSRMQLFSKDGVFIKKIGIHYIDIVAGLAITQSGLIIVVDSVSPTVYIINGETGTLNGWFDCSGHMKEPSDIIVKSDIPGNEYFICDFKGHCVVVFSEQGEYLRRIGHDGLTSYPNGIDISDDGDILVGDSHGNRFHVVVFDRNGNFVSQFECPHVKVSRCCGLKITREGYIVTLAKNNHHVLVLDTIHI